MKIFYKLLSSSLLVASLLCSAGVSQAEGFKIGVVDLQKALSESKAGKAAQANYKATVEAKQKEIDSLKTRFQAKAKELEMSKGKISESEYAAKQEELLTSETELKRTFQDSSDSLTRENDRIVSGLVQKIRGVVEGLGKEGSYDIIIENSGGRSLLYAAKSVDITGSVVERFNALGN